MDRRSDGRVVDRGGVPDSHRRPEPVSCEHDHGEPSSLEVIADRGYLRNDIVDHAKSVEETEICEGGVHADRCITALRQSHRQEVFGLVQKIAENAVQAQYDQRVLAGRGADSSPKQRVDLVLPKRDRHHFVSAVFDIHGECCPLELPRVSDRDRFADQS